LKFYVNETYDADTEMIPRRLTDGIETRPRRSKKRLETETTTLQQWKPFGSSATNGGPIVGLFPLMCKMLMKPKS